MLIRFIKKTPNINFLGSKSAFFITSGIFSLVSIVFLLVKGLNFGIDFKGGLLVEVKFDQDVEVENIRGEVKNLNIGDFSLQGLDNSKDNYLLKIEKSLKSFSMRLTQI